MSDQIEVYVRDSGDRALLNVYMPARLREQLITAIQQGTSLRSEIPIALELAVLDKWITNTEPGDVATKEPVHVRIPITAINVHFNE